MWVTAYGELGKNDLTHRSINFVATAKGDSDFTISSFSTYLLKGDDALKDRIKALEDRVGSIPESPDIPEGLLTQVFGGKYGSTTGYIVQSNGSLSHNTHASGFNDSCKTVLEGVFRAAALGGADVRNIGDRNVAAWMTFNLSNCTFKLGYQNSTTLLGVLEFYSSPADGADGASFRKETGKFKIKGTFQSGSTITVDSLSFTNVKTEDFA